MLRTVGQESCFKTPSTAHVPGFPLFPVMGVQSVDPFPSSPAPVRTQTMCSVNRTRLCQDKEGGF